MSQHRRHKKSSQNQNPPTQERVENFGPSVIIIIRYVLPGKKDEGSFESHSSQGGRASTIRAAIHFLQKWGVSICVICAVIQILLSFLQIILAALQLYLSTPFINSQPKPQHKIEEPYAPKPNGTSALLT